MKSIDLLQKQDLERIKVLCFDCDGVTVPEGTVIKESGGELTVKTALLDEDFSEKLELLKTRFFLVFSSGRSLLYLSRMYERILWDKVALQAEGGLFTLFKGKVTQLGDFEERFLKKSTVIKQKIRQLQATNSNIIGFEPKQFLVTVHCKEKDSLIEKIVTENDPENEYHCLWSGEAYDIGPQKFNKGFGLKDFLEKNGLSLKNVLAVGNDPNDQEMVKWAELSVTTDPKSVIQGADFISNQIGYQGGVEVVDKILQLINNGS